jgi:hypothetical protein
MFELLYSIFIFFINQHGFCYFYSVLHILTETKQWEKRLDFEPEADAGSGGDGDADGVGDVVNKKRRRKQPAAMRKKPPTIWCSPSKLSMMLISIHLGLSMMYRFAYTMFQNCVLNILQLLKLSCCNWFRDVL